MVPAKHIFAGICLLCIASCRSGTGLPEAQQEIYSADGWYGFFMPRADMNNMAQHNDYSTDPASITQDELEFDRQGVSAGLVTMVSKPINFGILGAVEVALSPTAKLKAIAGRPPSIVGEKGRDTRLIWFQAFKVEMLNVIQDKIINSGADTFGVLRGTFIIRSTGAGKMISSVPGPIKVIDQQRVNYQALFKRDPFSKEWKVLAADSALAGQDFVTDRLGEQLAIRGISK